VPIQPDEIQKRVRIVLQLGRLRKSLILSGPPIPRVGDVCTINGQDWPVVRTEDVEVYAEFHKSPGGKLVQVFPAAAGEGAKVRKGRK
jgi:hypothetical protein